MDEQEDRELDELWAEGTGGTDDSTVATEENIPDDDSDLLGDGVENTPTQAEDDAASAGADATQSELDKLYPQFVERFQKELAPQIQSQAVEEAMRRMKQSNKARDEQIKAQLAPLVDHFKKLEQQQVYTREDSQREYAAAYRAVADEIEAKEHAQNEAELRQRWLASQQGSMSAQQQASAPSERPIWQTSTEVRMNQILEQSGLSEKDPEWKSVPLQITHPDPNEALDYFRTKVASAVQARQQRIQASAKPKPMIDMGTGGTGASNPLAGIEDTDQLWELAKNS